MFELQTWSLIISSAAFLGVVATLVWTQRCLSVAKEQLDDNKTSSQDTLDKFDSLLESQKSQTVEIKTMADQVRQMAESVFLSQKSIEWSAEAMGYSKEFARTLRRNIDAGKTEESHLLGLVHLGSDVWERRRVAVPEYFESLNLCIEEGLIGETKVLSMFGSYATVYWYDFEPLIKIFRKYPKRYRMYEFTGFERIAKKQKENET